VNTRWTNCIYEIIKDSGEMFWASTLNEAAEILGVDFRTVRRHLEQEDLYSNGYYVEINGHKVRRIPVFYP
jgi:predicted ArsR family transcriptional regulator